MNSYLQKGFPKYIVVPPTNHMLKCLNSTRTLSTVLTLLIADIAFGQPLCASSQYPVVLNSDINKPVCYMQTLDGGTLDLSSLCGKVSSLPAPIAPLESEELQGGLDPNVRVAQSCNSNPEEAPLCIP